MENTLFEKTPIPKAYLTLAIPVVLSMVVQLIYNMVDTFFIALTGDTHLIAGVSICAPIFTALIAFGDIFALGGSSYMSRLLGAKDLDRAKRISAFCFYAALAFGLVVLLLMFTLRGPLLSLLGASSETMEHASAYYGWIMLGAPLIIFSMVPSNLLRTVGRPKESMFIMIIGAVVNMILDPIFIFALGMGAAGAALATVIGYLCSGLYAVVFIAKKCDVLSLELRQCRVSGPDIVSIFSIGLPAAVTNLMQTIGVALTNRALLPYGSDAIAVMGIVMKIVLIASLIVIGMAFGGQPLIGYTYGSGNRSRLKEVLRFAYKIVCGTALLVSAIIAIVASPFVRVFIQQPDLVKMGALMLRLQMPSIILMGIGLVTICTFQAIGKGTPAFLLSICRQGAVFAVVLLIMQHLFGYSGVISAQLVTDIVTVFIAFGLFYIYTVPELNENSSLAVSEGAEKIAE